MTREPLSAERLAAILTRDAQDGDPLTRPIAYADRRVLLAEVHRLQVQVGRIRDLCEINERYWREQEQRIRDLHTGTHWCQIEHLDEYSLYDGEDHCLTLRTLDGDAS